MTFTEARLLAALNRPGPSAAKRAEAIRERMPIWTAHANAAGIIDARDFAIFFGQVAIESDGFATAVEYWGPTKQQARYEGRRDLGNVLPGDGFRFRGRGEGLQRGERQCAESGEGCAAEIAGQAFRMGADLGKLRHRGQARSESACQSVSAAAISACFLLDPTPWRAMSPTATVAVN